MPNFRSLGLMLSELWRFCGVTGFPKSVQNIILCANCAFTRYLKYILKRFHAHNNVIWNNVDPCFILHTTPPASLLLCKRDTPLRLFWSVDPSRLKDYQSQRMVRQSKTASTVGSHHPFTVLLVYDTGKCEWITHWWWWSLQNEINGWIVES